SAMGESAINVARSCGYYGAGTVEFLVDDELNFYFLEMNTRLQVEHCVTEMITGVDLVREQIRVARGETLGYTQNDLRINGHAIELRICAEDPLNNFLPDIGKLQVYKRPQGPGIRVDDGYEEGMDIPIHYDPMIGKLIAWGETREIAIERLTRAIEDFRINGIETTLPFGKWAIHQPAYKEGKFDTHFIAKYYNPEALAISDSETQALAAVAAVHVFAQANTMPQPIQSQGFRWSLRAGKR
ncbi:MAG: biotin carboxylase, partial [Chitinophagaceae bacterium]|nr:biotin carboxylase [Chitinophagaceae bacterium]